MNDAIEFNDIDVFSAQLRKYRKFYSLSQLEFSKKIGVSHRYYKKIESGEANVTLKTIQKIAINLNTNSVSFVPFRKRHSLISHFNLNESQLIKSIVSSKQVGEDVDFCEPSCFEFKDDYERNHVLDTISYFESIPRLIADKYHIVRFDFYFKEYDYLEDYDSVICCFYPNEKSIRNDFIPYLKRGKFKHNFHSMSTLIKSYRIFHSKSQEYVSMKTGIDLRYYKRVESGQINLTFKTLCKIANVLKISSSDLFYYSSSVQDFFEIVDFRDKNELETFLYHLQKSYELVSFLHRPSKIKQNVFSCKINYSLHHCSFEVKTTKSFGYIVNQKILYIKKGITLIRARKNYA